MTILLAGGAGKTAINIAHILLNTDLSFIMTSRQGEVNDSQLKSAAASRPIPVVPFSYLDPETYRNCFNVQNDTAGAVSAIYIMVPPSTPAEPINAFIDFAIAQTQQQQNGSGERNAKGKVKFVLLSGGSVKIDAPMPLAQVWKHLSTSGADYAVLVPSWFTDNLISDEYLLPVRREGKLYTATEDGQFAWTATEDIAAVAVKLLTTAVTTEEVLGGKLYPIVGPELLTHDEVAEIMSQVLGRQVQHVRVSEAERVPQMIAVGKSEERARFVAYLEALCATGVAVAGYPSDTVKKMTRREPMKVSEWVEKHKDAWL